MASVQGVVGVLETVLSAISVNISASVLIMLTRVTPVSPVTPVSAHSMSSLIFTL